MKLDRLLSIVVYLINRDLVSARVLAERFGVSVRTIQRDLEAINLSGIPIVTIQGPRGGYGIMDNFKLDRALVTADDLFFIVTALKGLAPPLDDGRIGLTLEKIQGLLPESAGASFSAREERLYVESCALDGGPKTAEIFRLVRDAVDRGRVLEFSYTNNRLENVRRAVEPMTMVFRWRSWYLFGYCRLKQDFRLFRISRIRSPVVMPESFARRPLSYEDFMAGESARSKDALIDIVLRFSPEMASRVENFHDEDDMESIPDGSLVVRMSMPENGWLYGFILSYGPYVEVLEPERLRGVIAEGAERIARIYAPAGADSGSGPA